MALAEESIASSLGVLLLRSFRTAITDDIVESVADRVDSATYPIISGVARVGPVRVAALSEQIGLERSVVARRAALLIDGGLLRSTPDPVDARAALLSLTPHGERTVEIMRRRLIEGIAEQLSSWSADDRETFAALLARFVETELGAATARADELVEANHHR